MNSLSPFVTILAIVGCTLGVFSTIAVFLLAKWTGELRQRITELEKHEL